MQKILQKIKRITKQKKGFTLLETLVAIFILTLALTGPIYIATLAIRSSVETRDNISAYFLAEEAVEVIRNTRDQNSFKGQSYDWLGGFLGTTLRTQCHSPSGADVKNTCYITIGSTGEYNFVSCNGSCPPLNFNAQSPVTYGQVVYNDDDMSSKFTREIYIEDAQEGIEIIVHVTVKWVDKGRERQFEIVERLHKQDYGQYYSTN